MTGALVDGDRVPNLDGQLPFIAAFDVMDTVSHIELADDATLEMAVMAATQIRARIRPYSTAVAALVDRISSDKIRIVPSPPEAIVPVAFDRRMGRLTIWLCPHRKILRRII
jgi:hypothetical protein